MVRRRTPPKKINSSKNKLIYIATSMGICFILLIFIAMSKGGKQPAKVVAAAPTPSEPEVIIKTKVEEKIILPVARENIQAGEKLSKTPMRYVQVSKSHAEAFLGSQTDYYSAIAIQPIQANTPIPLYSVSLPKREKKQESSQSPVIQIPKGKRVISVNLDSSISSANAFNNGDYVDVILLENRSRSKNGGLSAKIIAENVQILTSPDTGKRRSRKSSSFSTFTLLASQREALSISAAIGMGKITFSLRGQGDNNPVDTKQVSAKEILGQTKSRSVTIGRAIGPDGKEWLLSDSNTWQTSNLANQ